MERVDERKEKAQLTTDELYKLVKENNRMLRAMRRDAFIGGIFKIVWWVLVLVVIPYLIYVWYLQPYLEQALSLYTQAQGQAGQVNDAVNQLKGVGESVSGLQRLLENFGLNRTGN